MVGTQIIRQNLDWVQFRLNYLFLGGVRGKISAGLKKCNSRI